MKWLKRGLAGVVIAVLCVPILLLIFGNSHPLSQVEIEAHAKRLNEAAAVQIPHAFLASEKLKARHGDLLKQVELGDALTQSQSAAYRSVFQSILLESQSFLARFDGELTVLHDVAMQRGNNIGALGIKGHHDHHDVSARANYRDVERALAALKKADGAFGFAKRIWAINLAQKSLADIISHMGVAPHTVSVAYTLPANTWRQNEIASTFEAMMVAYKRSQFQPVNGAEYWRDVDQAVEHYALLVERVQERLWAGSNAMERRIAGRFLDLQTLAPQLDADMPMRR